LLSSSLNSLGKTREKEIFEKSMGLNVGIFGFLIGYIDYYFLAKLFGDFCQTCEAWTLAFSFNISFSFSFSF